MSYKPENIRIVNGIKERRCTSCNEWYLETAEYFYMHNKKKPERGFQSECKKCAIKRALKRQNEKYDEILSGIQSWQKENRNKTLGYMRKFYQNNKDERREYVKDWVKKSGKEKEYANRHRKHDITNTEWKNCKDYFNNNCAYCGLPIKDHFAERNNIVFNMDFHKEHVDDNGANDLRNCVPSCQSCNSTKNVKTIDEFLECGFVEKFTKERYNKIQKWLNEDYKKYIEPKPPYIITRKQNEGQKTYHWELWTVDEFRNMVECIATTDKKAGLKPYIQKYFPEAS